MANGSKINKGNEMLTIKLSPVRADREPLEATWNAPILTVNQEPFDLTELPDGATATHAILGEVSRTGDDYSVKLTLPHGANAPYETRFPQDVTVAQDGPVAIPPYGQEEVIDELD